MVGICAEAALLAPFTSPATGTLAVEEREAGLLSAQTSIPTRLGGTALITPMLTLGSTITWQAGTARSPSGECTATSVVAGQLPTGHASVTVGPGITKLTCAGVS